MTLYRNAVYAMFGGLSAAVIALHSPGQMSVDSGIALYEGLTGQAEGWGPTFFAATVAWLGGGVVGAALFVAVNTALTYLCFVSLLTSSELVYQQPAWKRVLCVALALNPVFMFYAGILWKDVMLATMALVAATSLLVAPSKAGVARLALFATTVVSAAMLPLLRQQGIILAAPLALALAAVVAGSTTGRKRFVIGVGCLLLVAAVSVALDRASKLTIKPLPTSPVSVGMMTIRAYDIVGMVAYARPDDESDWSRADDLAKEQIRRLYSPERIDTLWHDPAVRSYINSLDEQESWSVWRAGIQHDPVAYLTHRFNAFAFLFGLREIKGCVPAYWGVAAPPEYLERAGLVEEMDPRDRLIGRWSQRLHGSPVFRNWFYAALLVAALSLLRHANVREFRVVGAIAIAAGLYLASYGPTTIACDFRYLYPVTCLSTALLIWVFLNSTPPARPHN